MKNAEQHIPVTRDITILIKICCFVKTPKIPVYGLASKVVLSIIKLKINQKKVLKKYIKLKESHLGQSSVSFEHQIRCKVAATDPIKATVSPRNAILINENLEKSTNLKELKW